MDQITAYQLTKLAIMMDPEIKTRTESGQRRSLDKAYQLWILAVQLLDNPNK
jgi:hypothetical protein